MEPAWGLCGRPAGARLGALLGPPPGVILTPAAAGLGALLGAILRPAGAGLGALLGAAVGIPDGHFAQML